MTLHLMKGNEAVAAAAILGGCTHYFGYPITPQSEVSEYMAREMPKKGRCFLQAESEIAAINMVYGASGAGARAMTSSSSPGIALKQEGISYIAGAELPCLIVDMMRGGPGLGSIQPSQTDYFVATRGGGNGDYRTLTYAPASVQEMVDLIYSAFDVAEKYRNPVLICGDGMLGQMMEPVDFDKYEEKSTPKREWASNGEHSKRGYNNCINSLYLAAEELEEHNRHLMEKYAKMRQEEVRVEEYHLEDCELVLSAFGTVSRICKSAIHELEQKGHKVGLIRPITLWPFPEDSFRKIPEGVRDVLVVEMNQGQMIDDVRIAVDGRQKVHFYGRQGGMVPATEEIVDACLKILEA
ncbi:MAG: 3-methyl-2-oxobutanoate dehydrogenase subunit VorB [Peptoniphilaceae bacterium]|nr:3-methyl-2-oxobutanoate dehydrogenase subunit VorB [Peptoniphilaceae bacterium]MDY5766566.1 3-methyl-2-oxobutanoate dehydrogenase subunit VorB [Peptoniphilaceae bacterium]